MVDNYNTNNLIAVGVITNVHGIKGMVKVKSFTENPDSLFDYSPVFDKAGTVVELQKSGTVKDLFLVKIDGVNDRNQAELLKGDELFINEEQLPELNDGEYYNSQLIGLKVLNTDNNEIGKVIDMHNYGAGDLVEVEFIDTKKSDLFLFANDVVKVDIENNFLILEIPSYIMGDKDKENDNDA
ncbi:MAG: ribosome maturation factor RimM [Alphaproteobacteria bacterium]